jgi:hypothetical protein
LAPSLSTNNIQCQPLEHIKGGPMFAEDHPLSSPSTTLTASTSITSTYDHPLCPLFAFIGFSMPSIPLAGEIRGEHSLSERKGPAVSGMVAEQVCGLTCPSLLPSSHRLAVSGEARRPFPMYSRWPRPRRFLPRQSLPYPAGVHLG